jgi:hypothetical protein
MVVNALLYAFGNGEIRPIDIPDEEMAGTVEQKLKRAFFYGQNDFQPKPFCSLSAGDVVILEGRNFLVKFCGFKELTADELERWAAIPRRERAFHRMVLG